MIKKLLFATLATLSIAGVSSAQDFTLTADTLIENTNGVTIPNGETWDGHAIEMPNYLHNNTDSSITFNWQIIQKTMPFGWFIYGFCDNQYCRPQDHQSLTNNIQQTSFPVAVGDSSLMELQIAVPSDAENGTGIVRMHAWHGSFSDTLTFIVNKTPTGISTISLKDSRVSIYPNPAQNTVVVYAEKTLNAGKVAIMDITGREVYNDTFDSSKEVKSINISSLVKGSYIARLTDMNGKVITARKFVKN